MSNNKPNSKELEDFLFQTELELYERILDTINKNYEHMDGEKLTSYYSLLQSIRPNLDKVINKQSKSELYNKPPKERI